MKKITIIILTLSFSASLWSENLPWADFKPFHFGFMLGTNLMDFGITPSMKQQNGTVYQADISTITPGFSVGIIGDLRLNNFFNLRTVPALYLGDRELDYVDNNNNKVFSTSVKSTMAYIPFYIKYNAVRINEYRPYLLGGGGMLIDMAHDKTRPILLNYTDYFVEVGFGWSMYLDYVKVSPEIRFSMGLTNALVNWSSRTNDVNEDYQPYSDALSRLTNRMVTICFNFE